MITLREYDFNWRVPDHRLTDVVAFYEIPEDISFTLNIGSRYCIVIPARAEIKNNGTESTSDVTDIEVGSGTISFKLPYLCTLTLPNYKLIEVSDANGNEMSATVSGKTVTVSGYNGEDLTIHYIPINGEIQVMHETRGEIKTLATVSRAATQEFVGFDYKSLPKIQKGAFLSSRTHLNIAVKPYMINGEPKYKFDPFKADGKLSKVVFVELTLH